MQIPAVLKTEAGLAIVGVIGLFLIVNNIKRVVAGAVVGAADVIVDAGTGAVIGIGDIIGVPHTDENECEAAMREGRSWDASFACPAGTFLNYTLHGYIDTKNKGLM
jgi:hypothetical protein